MKASPLVLLFQPCTACCLAHTNTPTPSIARHCRLSHFCRTAPSPRRYCVLPPVLSCSRPRALSCPLTQGEGFFKLLRTAGCEAHEALGCVLTRNRTCNEIGSRRRRGSSAVELLLFIWRGRSGAWRLRLHTVQSGWIFGKVLRTHVSAQGSALVAECGGLWLCFRRLGRAGNWQEGRVLSHGTHRHFPVTGMYQDRDLLWWWTLSAMQR